MPILENPKTVLALTILCGVALLVVDNTKSPAMSLLYLVALVCLALNQYFLGVTENDEDE